MSGSAPAVLMSSSVVVLMAACECLIYGVSSIAPSFTSHQKRILETRKEVSRVELVALALNVNSSIGSPAGRMSPTKAQQTMSYAPPLLRLAGKP
jgi:hypothetical protein